MADEVLSYDYIRGLTAGEGCFSFCKDNRGGQNVKLPTFTLAMSNIDGILINLVKETLGLRNKVYSYGPRKSKDGYERVGMAILTVRDFGQLKNIIVPLFYKKLVGNKAVQFENWVNNMASDPLVPEIYKLIPKLYQNGYYEKNWVKYG